jgi:PTH1 family peptidyl-tRNA hydrolase
MVRCVIGLGNPGRRYRRTRHNLGFMAVESLCLHLRGGRWRRQGEALLSRAQCDRREVFLAKPQTFMNNSGVAVRELVRSFGLSPEELVLVHDDLDLPVGRIRLRPGGSAGGHRGVASVIGALGTEKLGRVRIGIGRPPPGLDPVSFVLAPLSRAEKEALAGAVEQAVNRFNSGQEPGKTGVDRA